MNKPASNLKLLEEYIGRIVYNILHESKQSVVNLGYPEVIASLLVDKFGKNAHTIAKWFKQSFAHRFRGGNYPKDWFYKALFFSRLGSSALTLTDLVTLYNTVKSGSKEEYINLRKKLDLYVDPEESFDSKALLKVWKAELANEFFNLPFFSNQLIEDIMNGKLQDVKPYKNLDFEEASKKYDEKNIFSDNEPIKKYKNGWKWINVGFRCRLVGRQMKNCGSASVMSDDPDRTIIALYDPNNKPHVVVTYSPNQNKISGDEGVASSAAKEKYHKYILDLADTLNAEFDAKASKSKSLKIKSILRDKIAKIQKIDTKSPFVELYKLTLKNGKVYYSDGQYLVPEKTMQTLAKKEGSYVAAIHNLSRKGRDWIDKTKDEYNILYLDYDEPM